MDMNVPITELLSSTENVATLQAMKLEVTGEYMVMAGQLMLIKSQALAKSGQDTMKLKRIWSKIARIEISEIQIVKVEKNG